MTTTEGRRLASDPGVGEVRNRVALVTGGTSGIGAAICRRLASQEAHIAAGSTVPEKVLDRIRAQIPLRRLGRPEEIARVVCFLAGDESAYITGQVWSVNGGLDM